MDEDFLVLKERLDGHINDMQTVLSRIHSYTDTVRDDIKTMNSNVVSDIKIVCDRLAILSARIDDIWLFLGKKQV